MAYYSLIQYCPDPSRLEVCNVGVVLWDAPWVGVKTTTDLSRVARFFGADSFDAECLLADIEAMASRVRRVEWNEWDDMVRTRANGLLCTSLRSVQPYRSANAILPYITPGGLDACLDDLFERLVMVTTT